jgi:hypothetical protein
MAFQRSGPELEIFPARGYVDQTGFFQSFTPEASMSSPDHYIPGVCNIGPAETKMRSMVGWGGSVAAVLLAGALLASGAAAPWRLLVFFPAFFGATGFLQAGMHFCAGYGMRALYNFGPMGAGTESVEQAESRLLDRRKAQSIFAWSLAVAAAAAVVAYLV